MNTHIMLIKVKKVICDVEKSISYEVKSFSLKSSKFLTVLSFYHNTWISYNNKGFKTSLLIISLVRILSLENLDNRL